MEDEELKELLKIDFPEIKGDEEKTLAVCKVRYKHNKKVTRLTYALSIFVIIACVGILSIVLINNKTNDVIRINKAINNLERIDNDEERILKIMEIEQTIQSISVDKQTDVNISRLSSVTASTVSNLQRSVEWNECIDKNNNYALLNDAIVKDEIIGISFANGINGDQWYTQDRDFIDGLIKLVELPYANVIDKDPFLDNYWDMLGDYGTSLYIRCHSNNDMGFITINVYQSGYVVVRVYNKVSSDLYYNIEFESIMVSLIHLELDMLIRYLDEGISASAVNRYENVKYESIEKDNVMSIVVYYGDELFDVIDESNCINKFLNNFKNIELKEIQVISNSTSSLQVDYTKEYLNMLEELENAYMIEIQYANDEYYFYIGENNYIYIINSMGHFKSTQGIYNIRKIMEDIKN